MLPVCSVMTTAAYRGHQQQCRLTETNRVSSINIKIHFSLSLSMKTIHLSLSAVPTDARSTLSPPRCVLVQDPIAVGTLAVQLGPVHAGKHPERPRDTHARTHNVTHSGFDISMVMVEHPHTHRVCLSVW